MTPLAEFHSSQRNRLILLAAAFVFVLVQTATLQHSHDGDLSIHSDCHICLKLGSQGDAAVTQPVAPQVELFTTSHKVFIADLNALVVPQPKSRAPPQTV